MQPRNQNYENSRRPSSHIDTAFKTQNFRRIFPKNILMKVAIQDIGYFKKKKDGTIINGQTPPKLNTNPLRNGEMSPENKMNLTLGLENFSDEGGGGGMIYTLLFIEQEAEKMNEKCLKNVVKSDFVTNRASIAKIAESHHNSKDPMRFFAIRQKGVIFFFKTEYKMDPYDKVVPYGYKFEQYLTLDDDDNEFDIHSPVSNAEQVKCVHMAEFTKLESKEMLRVYYSAEVDAVFFNGKNNEKIELKAVSGGIDNNARWWKFKSLATYFQSYFGNTSKIIVGTTTPDRHVTKVTTYTPNQLDTNRNKTWNANVCKNHLFEVLKIIKETLTEDGMVMEAIREPFEDFEYQVMDTIVEEEDAKFFKNVNDFALKFV